MTDFAKIADRLYPATPNRGKDYGYGKRSDGAFKGPGFLGPLKRPDGNVSTELSVGVGIDGKEMDIPLIVPTLTKKEIDHLLKDGEPTDKMVGKAIEHAVKRMKEGKSVFFGQDDEPAP